MFDSANTNDLLPSVKSRSVLFDESFLSVAILLPTKRSRLVYEYGLSMRVPLAGPMGIWRAVCGGSRNRLLRRQMRRTFRARARPSSRPKTRPLVQPPVLHAIAAV